MTKRAADVLIETLQAAGVERCYGIVGDTLNRIAHAIDRSAIGTRRPEHSRRTPKLSSPATSPPAQNRANGSICGPGSLHFLNGLSIHIGRRHPVTIGAGGDIKTTLEALLPRLAQHDKNA
jgi:pyruvate dehydrogenase (quinone)